MNRRNPLLKLLITSVTIIGLAATGRATSVLDLGTSGPPSGFSSLTDSSAIGDLLNSLSAPGGGTVSFSSDLEHAAIGNGWGTWSHGYLGDVYLTGFGVNSLTLTLPSATAAFLFYVEPNAFGSPFNFDVNGVGTSSTTGLSGIPVDGNGGAKGFRVSAGAGEFVTSITISSTEDFAIAEFGIITGAGSDVEVPETGYTLLYVGLSALALCGVRCAVRAVRNARRVAATGARS